MLKNSNIDVSGLEYIAENIHEGKLRRSIIYNGDILFSIAGTIGRVAVVPIKLNNSNINQAVAFIRLTVKKFRGHMYFWLKSEKVQNDAMSKIVQGVQANLSLGELGDMQYPLPEEDDIIEQLNLILESKLNLIEENKKLIGLRNTLLPRLMSGEIDLSEIEGEA